MQMQILSPGMQHREETDLGAEQSGIGRLFPATWPRLWNRMRRSVSGSEVPGVQICEQREYDVEIGHGQKLGFALREPARAGLGLALGAVPVPARVI